MTTQKLKFLRKPSFEFQLFGTGRHGVGDTGLVLVSGGLMDTTAALACSTGNRARGATRSEVQMSGVEVPTKHLGRC